ncbi:MAG: LLM class flavin-dependent oxidoreductase [Rhodospirillaceae bacterium]|jgi:FMN-dependent oxidoreductase (nitrilotriacetate monooxygenase family)|nr:LLM class flavin-dependent oxidoreductase [Rhodospirillaceae bacterium]MBT5080471.1 LLM class flavin-dependent oxidoreductase [Rhodospirillaceae bacterium]MBT5523201.1 LLM class flavin-dependent oxidoreductase [Rhodospirillaceae bacterium]MBT5879234.1 LLM class flavin-dependent oxidoreductase [Rhodospirillaceae bacterium]MBT6912513.1 LLM class flavin-dependent oxidoreductase [Rhodospirillaceae bacterium]
MSDQRQLRLGAFMRPVSIHTAAWRYPGGTPDANFNLKAITGFAQTLERGRFDAFFMADHLAVLNMPMDALKRSATVTSFDPLTLLPALAMVTEHLGLIATASTTFEPAYTIARRFASLDHISGGRAAWNLVTTSNPDAALNFGMEEHMAHGDRYARAREIVDVVTGLWDSWADDAFIRDADSGIYFDTDKMHVLDHKGEYLSVRGPLNIARPIQGWPVIVQAGASEAGRQLAAETAEVIFAATPTLADGKAFYADVKGRMDKLGRPRDHLKVLPGAFVVVGDTADEAKEKRALLDSLVHYDSGIASLSIALGHDASKFDPDGPLPEIPESNASKSGRERVIALAEREGLSVRQLAGRLGGYSGLAMVGTATMIADQMQEWLEQEGSDGFNVMFPYLPGGLDDFVDKVVPELQRRGLFRREYEGTTLRENLGLPRPENQFFPAKS